MATRLDDVSTHLAATPDIDAILRHLPVGAVVVEAPGCRFLAINAHAQELWQGAMPEPHSVDEYSDVFAGFRADGRQYLSDEWPVVRAAVHGEVVAEEEIEFRFASGERRIMMVSASPVRDETGDVVRAVALFHDVTNQRQEERRREFLMELSDELRLIDDPVAIMEIAAAATGEQLGVTSASYADIDANVRYAVVHAEYRNGRIAPRDKYYLEDFGVQLVARLRQGSTVAVEDITADPLTGADVFEGWNIRSLISVPIVRQGELVSIFTVMHSAPRRWSRSDTALVQQVAERTWHAVHTARVQAELRQSREWLSVALRAGSAAVWDWDLRSGRIHWSEEHGLLLGVTGEHRTLTFGRWLALVHPDDRPAAKTAARRIATMREGEIEFEHRVAGSSEPRWIAMRGRVMADAQGLPCRVVGVAVDSTDRKLAELERETLLQQAREASDAKSHFISVISHEFRTPLTAIIGYTDLLSTGTSAGTLSPAQDRQLDRIRASAWHLTQLVDEILTFSRIEAGAEGLVPDTTDVLSLAREANALVAPAAASKGLALACELPDESVTISTDSGKLRQVLLNLLGNAIKFTEKGGITLRVLPQPDRVEFVVHDTGVGIAPDDVPRVFERFWQANQDGARAISGAGLGLTVSRQLVELLGGTISVQSEPGRGSTFRFHVPRSSG